MTEQAVKPRAKSKPKTIFKTPLTSLAISSVSEDDLRSALAGPDVDLEDLVQKLMLFPVVGYFTPAMTREQSAQRLSLFEAAVRGIPELFVTGAFDEWFQSEPRAPTPGDIKRLAGVHHYSARSRLGVDTDGQWPNQNSKAIIDWCRQHAARGDWPTSCKYEHQAASAMVDAGEFTFEDLERFGYRRKEAP